MDQILSWYSCLKGKMGEKEIKGVNSVTDIPRQGTYYETI